MRKFAVWENAFAAQHKAIREALAQQGFALGVPGLTCPPTQLLPGHRLWVPGVDGEGRAGEECGALEMLSPGRSGS